MAVDERAALSAAACMCPAPPSRRLESQHPESPDLPGRAVHSGVATTT
jgi:hypothetical protein